MEIKEVVSENVKTLKEDTLEIAKVVFELNSLIMEMPFVHETNTKVRKKLAEKCRIVYDKCDDNIREAYRFGDLLGRVECNRYVKQLNIYLNALSTFVFVTNCYIQNYMNKFKPHDDIEAIYNYYQKIGEQVDGFCKHHTKYIKKLDEGYYDI